MSTEEHIQQTLTSFWAAMFEWETQAYQFALHYLEKGQDFPKDELRGALRAIHEKHVTAKERKLGRLKNLNFGEPPEYDPSLEHIHGIEVNNNSATVKTERVYAGKPRERIYKLMYSDGAWKIDAIEELDARTGKWRVVHI